MLGVRREVTRRIKVLGEEGRTREAIEVGKVAAAAVCTSSAISLYLHSARFWMPMLLEMGAHTLQLLCF